MADDSLEQVLAGHMADKSQAQSLECVKPSHTAVGRFGPNRVVTKSAKPCVRWLDTLNVQLLALLCCLPTLSRPCEGHIKPSSMLSFNFSQLQ